MSKERLVFKLTVLPLVLLGCFTWMNKVLASGYLPPRLSLDANAGGSATVGRADLMLSLKGDTQHNLYLDPQASYGTDEQWYGDLGLGYRGIKNEAAILGAYLFAGHTQVANQSGFWIANPGVEALGSRWDARINGYIPIGGRSNDLGIFPFIQSSRQLFSGHTQRSLVTYVMKHERQQIGDGVDAKLGYQVFRGFPLKAYLGAYFFDVPHTDNVRGGAAGVEYWFDHHVKAFANYSYDNLQHSTVVGGLAVSFGGMREDLADPSLSERLTDPVERYLANLGHGAGIPSETLFTVLPPPGPGPGPGPGFIPADVLNLAFFSATGWPNNGGVGLTMANCTFERPCGPSDFSQTGINTLNNLMPATRLYVSTGTYPARNGTANPLSLNNGQVVSGVTANYADKASGAARPTFNGAFILTGNNALDSIILNNSLGSSVAAIASIGGQNLHINNSTIGTSGVAISLLDANAVLAESTVNAGGQIIGSPSLVGIGLLGGSSLLVQSSNINVTASAPVSNVVGILLTGNSHLMFTNGSQLTVSVSGANSVIGIHLGALGNNMAAINNNSSVNITTTLLGPPVISALGLLTETPSSMISMDGGTIAFSNIGIGAIPTSGNVLVNGTVCTINGLTIPC